jgi:methionyl-tRNA synthetase
MEQILLQNIWVLVALAIWTLPWKGYALWKSARRGEKWWFVALLLVNSLAILEIVYIFFFSKKEISHEK